MTLLVLAGTAEARQILWSLADSGRTAIASLAGATRHPEPLPVPTRTGGFGGAQGFTAYLDDARITAVLDATHPFAARISARTALICAQRGLPYAQVLRPGWQAGEGDDWTWIDAEEDATRIIPQGKTVFLATGRQTIHRFAGLAGRRVLLRQIDPPTAPFPFEGGEFVIARPPFSQDSEEHLFAALGVDWLVAKDAGGADSRTKLDAARTLGIPVLLLRRPPPAGGTTLTSVPEALAWVESL